MTTIFIAPLSEANMSEAETLNAELLRALESADIGRTDEILLQLSGLSDRSLGLELPENDWQRYLAAVRQSQAGFSADCVLQQGEVQLLAAAALACGCPQLQELTIYPGCIMLPQQSDDTEEEIPTHV